MNSLRNILILASWLLILSSCDITKSLFRSSTTTHTTESHEASTSTTTQRSQDWQINSSSLEHRDGMLSIDFEGTAAIDIAPDGTIRATGTAPTIRSHTSSTRADTSSIRTTASEYSTQDSTGSSAKESTLELKVTDRFKQQETQKIWPILLFIFLIIIALILLFRPKTFRL